MGAIKVAAAHVAPVFMDAAASARKAADWIARAGADGVKLIVFPEVFLPGFPYWINCYPPLIQAGLNRRYQDQSVEVGGPELKLIQDAARAAGVVVVMGASERRVGGRTCHNTSFVIDADGALLLAHRKLQPTYAERYIWGQGDGSTLLAVDSAIGKIGALACWEHTMNLARQALAEQGAQIHAALWPSLSTMPGFDQIANVQIEAMMRSHALTAQCFVVCASSPVSADMLDFMRRELGDPGGLLNTGGGWSAVIHPFCATLAGPVSGLEEQLAIADISLEDLHDVKMWLDTTGHYARPEILRLVHDRRQYFGVEPIDSAPERAS